MENNIGSAREEKETRRSEFTRLRDSVKFCPWPKPGMYGKGKPVQANPSRT